MSFSDPPYNVSLGDHGGQQRGSRRRRIANDSMDPISWEVFVRAWARTLLAGVCGAIYVCMSSKEMPLVSRVLAEEGGHWSDTLIWHKDRFVLGRADWPCRTRRPPADRAAGPRSARRAAPGARGRPGRAGQVRGSRQARRGTAGVRHRGLLGTQEADRAHTRRRRPCRPIRLVAVVSRLPDLRACPDNAWLGARMPDVIQDDVEAVDRPAAIGCTEQMESGELCGEAAEWVSVGGHLTALTHAPRCLPHALTARREGCHIRPISKAEFAAGILDG